MTEASTFSAADQALCLGVLKQMEVGKIDYDILRTDLNLPTKGSAQVRWSRFNSKLKKGGDGSFTTADQALCLGVLKQIEVGKIDYQRLSTERGRLPNQGDKHTTIHSINHQEKGTSVSSGKKRKFETDDEENGNGTQGLNVKTGAGGGGGEDGLMDAFETPTKSIRRAKVSKFTEAATDDEDEDVFEDAVEGVNLGGFEKESEIDDES
ncbi:hypothetical protein LOCC1_G001812 [Lachnellula occidentalis]|uniref:Myb-like DNA-binding domain-containing protein n=1 Tax=Lachnellula occidentalis TaxID=215460 RepID=A0A8H8S5S4_9HELO|nr:hypothetical protein LOCC1_G001812 [Lachnellula occidentalis]